MADIEAAMVLCGQLTQKLSESPVHHPWILARRRWAAVALAQADFEWEGGLEDLDRMVLLGQAGLPGQLSRIVPRTHAAAGHILRQAEVAMPSTSHVGGGEVGMPHGGFDRYGTVAQEWSRTTRSFAETFVARAASLPGMIRAIRDLAHQEAFRSSLMVAASMALPRRWGLGPEVPGLWGTLPGEDDRYSRFEPRFVRSLTRQAKAGLDLALEFEERDRRVLRRLERMPREGTNAVRAWRAMLARRVLSPALLARELGISVRGASLLLDRLADAGIFVEAVDRKSYRRFVAEDDDFTRSVIGAHGAPARRTSGQPVLLKDERPPVVLPADLRSRDPDSETETVAADSWEALLSASDAANERVTRMLREFAARRSLVSSGREERDLEIDAGPAQADLHRRGIEHQVLPVIVDACSAAIEDGTGISGEWREVGWSNGGVDWVWHEETTYSDEAQRLMPVRALVSELIELLELIDDHIAAQREIGNLLN